MRPAKPESEILQRARPRAVTHRIPVISPQLVRTPRKVTVTYPASGHGHLRLIDVVVYPCVVDAMEAEIPAEPREVSPEAREYKAVQDETDEGGGKHLDGMVRCN